MKLSLYQIEQSFLQLADRLIEAGGELTPELEEELNINKDNLTTKGTNYGFIVKEMESEISVIKSEIDRLTALKKSREKAVDKLANTLSVAMQVFGVEKIESPVMKISFRNSETVEIDNIAQLDKDFIKVTVTETPDKVAIKTAIKEGREVNGARIETHKNIQIK